MHATHASTCRLMRKTVRTEATSGYLSTKRVFDVVFAALALILLTPILLLVALLVKATSKGPVIFSQKRVGKDGRLFNIYKFRSMVKDAEQQISMLQCLNERDGPVFKISDDPRETAIGSTLRTSCLDELPQLWNILKGEMSFVGPRPALPREVEQYKPWQRQRLFAKPGLTCYWQVSNRQMTFDEWVESDIRYINERSLWLDLRLILRTLPVFITGHK